MTVDSSCALIFSPHQDDETLGCGGLIALKKRQGAEVHIAFLTDGSRGCFERGNTTSERLTQIRKNEALAATKALGVQPSALTFLGFPDGGLSTLTSAKERELVQSLEELLISVNPAEVYLPFRGDLHDDHRATHRAVLAALRRSGRNPQVFGYPIWALEIPLRAGFRWAELRGLRSVPINEALEDKHRALACYRSQLEPQDPSGHVGLPPEFLAHFLKSYELYFPVSDFAER